jgi:uncharacterized protein YaiI (UPF0178 family)
MSGYTLETSGGRTIKRTESLKNAKAAAKRYLKNKHKRTDVFITKDIGFVYSTRKKGKKALVIKSKFW